MKTPEDKEIILTLRSIPINPVSARWVARVTFPAGASVQTRLPIEVMDGEDVPVAAGCLEFAGRQLKVKDGRASLAYADFVAGKHARGVWLHRDGSEPVPGGLTFE